MKRLSLALVGLAAVGIGCQSEPAAVPQTSQSTAAPKVENHQTDAAMTFVSLKVPNMV